MKNKEEITKYLRENPIKNVMNLLDIEKCLNNDGMTIPDGVATINSMGVGSADFIKWYETCEKKYPKTYVECCQYLGYDDRIPLKIIGEFIRLINARNAYWKIAGEQLGLEEPWQPDWNHINRKFYCIYNSKNNIVKNVIYSENKILVFPTEEMRDAFYENFKDLIEYVKELL